MELLLWPRLRLAGTSSLPVLSACSCTPRQQLAHKVSDILMRPTFVPVLNEAYISREKQIYTIEAVHAPHANP